MPDILAAQETEIRKEGLGSKTMLEKVLETLPQKTHQKKRLVEPLKWLEQT
jgi:hypothetical protein